MTDPTLAAQIEALAPCPFCGGEAMMIASNGVPHDSPLAGGTRRVECQDCYATGPAEPSPRIGTAWNTRPAIVTALRQAEAAPGVVEALGEGTRAAFEIGEDAHQKSGGATDGLRNAVAMYLARQHGAREGGSSAAYLKGWNDAYQRYVQGDDSIAAPCPAAPATDVGEK